MACHRAQCTVSHGAVSALHGTWIVAWRCACQDRVLPQQKEAYHHVVPDVHIRQGSLLQHDWLLAPDDHGGACSEAIACGDTCPLNQVPRALSEGTGSCYRPLPL